MQIAESVEGQRRIVAHVGSARTEAELGVLLERARALLTDDAQGELDLGVEPSPGKVDLVAAPATEQPLFGVPGQPAGRATRVGPARVVATCSRLLFDTLTGVYDDLGFGVLGDEVFRDLVIARIVEPTSILDTGRVLADLGRVPGSEKTMRRTLGRCVGRGYRDQVAALCFAHATTTGDLSLVLYDVTTLYFQAEAEDALRKVGYSKERRVDPQIVVGLLVDRTGAPLEIGCYAGNKAETQTIIPIVEQFARRHQLADMAVVADAGMLSASNLRELDDAHLRFIVGSRLTKAPIDLASHFRWHGDAFTDGQVIDTLTPKSGRVIENDPLHKAEPVWDPAAHPASWRAVWAYSAKRAARDGKTLTAQENRAKAVVAGEKSARTPRFVTITNGTKALDAASLARARRLAGLKGYVTNIPATRMPAARSHRQLPRPLARRAVVSHVEDRSARPPHVRPNPGCDRGPPDHRVRRARGVPRGPATHRARDPQRHPPATPATGRHHRHQRRRTDHPTRRHRRTAGPPRRHQQPTAQALTRMTKLRPPPRSAALASPPPTRWALHRRDGAMDTVRESRPDTLAMLGELYRLGKQMPPLMLPAEFALLGPILNLMIGGRSGAPAYRTALHLDNDRYIPAYRATLGALLRGLPGEHHLTTLIDHAITHDQLENVPRQGVGRISLVSNVGVVGSARPRCTSLGRLKAMASWGRISLYSTR